MNNPVAQGLMDKDMSNSVAEDLEREDLDLKHRKEYHKSRHFHYKKRYRHARRFFWYFIAALILLLVMLVSVAILYSKVKAEQQQLQAVLRNLEKADQQMALLSQQLSESRVQNYLLTKERYPQLRLLEHNQLLPVDYAGITSVMFSNENSGLSSVYLNYQLLLEEQLEGNLNLVLLGDDVQVIQRFAIDVSKHDEDNPMLLQGKLRLSTEGETVRYFRFEQNSDESD